MMTTLYYTAAAAAHNKHNQPPFNIFYDDLYTFSIFVSNHSDSEKKKNNLLYTAAVKYKAMTSTK